MTSVSSRIPLLVTMDLEVAGDHDLAEQAAILERLCVDLRRLALPITIFATADAAVKFEAPFARWYVRATKLPVMGSLIRAPRTTGS